MILPVKVPQFSKVNPALVAREMRLKQAVGTFAKGNMPEYRVISREKNYKGETVSAKFEKIGGLKGVLNRMFNDFLVASKSPTQDMLLKAKSE